MARKFPQRYLKPTLFEPKGSIFEGVTWHVRGSSPEPYAVECTAEGFTCDCTGFTYRGRCKHSAQILKQVEEAVDGRAKEYHWV
jgi:hypothetical protein